ncbi:unnamed protein product [Moneuplotes crassus]|uniref:Uncharacterized protein n=1 Tax=Euplotes crassus TaxID=5936 RepID=A0AAD1UAI7_EUPCR|nr:unnamed protein product [Moneuplotes crassus]
MGNKTVGKKHNRQSTLANLQNIDLDHLPKYVDDPVEFFNSRMEFRESLETWGYFWAHKLIEDAFIRPNFDISLLNKISTVNNDLDLSFGDFSEAEETKDYSGKEVCLTAQVSQLKKDLEKKGSSFIKNTLGTAMMVTRKLTLHVHVIGIAVTLLEVMLEFESEDKVDEEIDTRIDKAKGDLDKNILKSNLTDLKAKFLAVKNTFELVVNGSDNFDIRRARLDSVLGVCEEISLMIRDTESDIYKSAHQCLDIVFLFCIMHLSMLDMSISTFKMKDYCEDYSRNKQYYDLLMQSYVEQALANYIHPVVLNYHNQYSSFKETEEIFYELSSMVVHRVENNKTHSCWNADIEEMKKDNMFYHFKFDKLKEIDPPFFAEGTETPLLLRALRYGMCLKLEEMMAQYNEVKAIFSQDDVNQQLQEINEGLDFDSDLNDQKENISPMKEESKEMEKIQRMEKFDSCRTNQKEDDNYSKQFDKKYHLIDQNNPHFKKIKKTHLNKINCEEIKKKAAREQKMLVEFYSSNEEELASRDKGLDQFFFQAHLHELLTENQEIFENLSKYIIFSEENKRFFDVAL